MATNPMSIRWSLNEWQAHLASLFDETNRDRKPDEVFCRTLEMFSGLARGFRDDDQETIDYFAPRATAWVFALASKLGINLEEAIWTWRPGICPHCRKSVDCQCIIGKTRKNPRLSDPIEIKTIQNQHKKPETFGDWVETYKKIYHEANRQVGVDKCLLHVLEELGEVHEMMRGLPHEWWARRKTA